MAAGKLARQGDGSRRVGTNSRPRMREGGQHCCAYLTCACMSTEGTLFEMHRQTAQAASADDGEDGNGDEQAIHPSADEIWVEWVWAQQAATTATHCLLRGSWGSIDRRGFV